MRFEDFKLERFFAKHEFTAKHLISCSDSESVCLSELLDLEPGSRKIFESLSLGYSDSRGILPLRSEIKKLYTKISETEILTHAGGQEPILNLFLSSIGPTDHVITHFPGYQSGYSIPKNLGADVSYWRAKPAEGWRLDLGELRALLRANTKLLVLNCPHNPTGYVMPLPELEALVELLREREILLFSDEIYRGLELDGSPKLPAAADLYEGAISMGGLAKVYGLAGLRTGWVATRHAPTLEALARQKDYSTICNPIVTEWLAALALRHGEYFIEKNRAIVSENIGAFSKFLTRNPGRFDWTPPRAGTMGFAWRCDGKSMEPFAAELLAREELMLLSGKYFDTDEKFFRIGLGRKNFPEVLALLERNLDRMV